MSEARPLSKTTKAIYGVFIVLLLVVAVGTIRLAFYGDQQKTEKQTAQVGQANEQAEKKDLAAEVDRICATKTPEAETLRKKGKCAQAREIIAEPTAGPTGPQGAQGIRGPAGPAGPEGPAGAQGPMGPQGKQGPPPGCALLSTACIGATGNQGPQGPQGETGPQGKEGPAGKDGVDGTNGKDGVDGTNGKDGADGKQGEPGPTCPEGSTLQKQQVVTDDDGAGPGLPAYTWIQACVLTEAS